MAKIDWEYWRNKFVTGTMSLKDLSEGHGAPAFKTLRNRSSTEKWPEQRDRYKDIKAVQASISPDVQQTADMVKRIIDSAEMLTRHAQAARFTGGLGIKALRLKNPEDISTKDAIALIKLGVDIERLTEGLATTRNETQFDPAKLSTEELRAIARGGDGGI